jgi:hypothetical protein
MAIIWNTVHDHHGHIDIQSDEGKGTIFSLYFPATRQQLYKGAGIISIDEYSGNGEHILVVDDRREYRFRPKGIQPFFQSLEKVRSLEFENFNQHVRHIDIYLCRNYSGNK